MKKKAKARGKPHQESVLRGGGDHQIRRQLNSTPQIADHNMHS